MSSAFLKHFEAITDPRIERLVLPVPAIYIIDTTGLAPFNYVNPNYKVCLHADLLLKAASLVR